MAGRIRPKERQETEYTTAGQPTVPSYSSLPAELPSEYFQKKPEKSSQELQKVIEELEIIGAEHRRLVDAMEDGRDKEDRSGKVTCQASQVTKKMREELAEK